MVEQHAYGDLPVLRRFHREIRNVPHDRGVEGHLPASTNCMRAIAVTVLLTDPIPYFVVGEGFLPAVLTRPKVWLHTLLPLATNATETDVAFVCFMALRTAWRPSLMVVLNVGVGFLPATDACAAGTPPMSVALATVAMRSGGDTHVA